jgi:(4S)-4-hydroxy-5-phosphonooxypentane-2,3-dione isomerase
MFVITVDFFIKPEHRGAFVAAVTANAQQSLALEPGCQQFDVCVAADDPCHVFLYEVYGSEGDFNEHLKTAHFLSFNDASSPWVLRKAVARYGLINASN